MATTKIANLQADAQLDPTIQFAQPAASNLAAPEVILITGATGFLGAYLLTELLHTTTADIYCLVRCRDRDAGMQRLKSHLEFYKIWHDELSSRIIPVVGDLSQRQLGLSEAACHELAEQVDVIYHNGAQVNAVYPYARLKATNVGGTQEVLRFAGLRRTKPVHFVSSLAVFLSQTYGVQVARETDFPEWDGNLKGGYKQSKWVAERLVMQAQERGLLASIYRPGIILEHSQTGIRGKVNNIISGIDACIQLGKFPVLETTTNFAPVDYVSQAIVHLSRQETSVGKAFHLCNPKSISWRELFTTLRALGHPLEEIGYNEWLKELESHALQHPENKSFSFTRFLMRLPMNLFSEGPKFDVQQTLGGLADTSIAPPPIDEKLLSTYFS